MTIARKQDLKCSQEWQFCDFFYAFEIKKGNKEDYMEVEGSKTETEL